MTKLRRFETSLDIRQSPIQQVCSRCKGEEKKRKHSLFKVHKHNSNEQVPDK